MPAINNDISRRHAGASIAVLITALATLSLHAANTMTRAAELILSHQTSDGAIVMGMHAQHPSHVIPYCANFAALGLVAANKDTGDGRYLDAAQHWADWYSAHMSDNGTICDFDGTPGQWKSTGKYDSSDSYAATYLELLAAIESVSEKSAWITTRLPGARKAVSAIHLTLQTNNLTFAKPDWPVMYLMDNTETARGLRAAARLGLGTAPLAAAMERAIQTQLWDASRQSYAVGLEKNGLQTRSEAKWYPYVMANLMAIGWLPPEPRHAALLARLEQTYRAEIPSAVRTEKDLEHLVWWGIAARGAGNRAPLVEIRGKLDSFDVYVKTFRDPNLLGHLCRIVARD